MRLQLMTASFLLVVVPITMLPAADGHPDAVGVPVFAFGDQPGVLPEMISTPAGRPTIPLPMREWLHETSRRKGDRAQDDVVLAIQKSGNDLLLSWMGQSGSVSVLRADEPRFSRTVTTLEDGYVSTALAVPVAESEATITYFEVSDAETASRAVTGLGYEPRPAPRVNGAKIRQTLPWWGSSIQMQGSYFAPIEESNLTFMHDRPVRASLVGGLVPGTSPGREYATEATFDIPGDARGGFITIQADGPEVSENDPYLPLVAPGIQYSTIWGLSWAPSTGRFWVSADNQIDEIDLFRFDPTRTTFVSGATQPRISRPTQAGQILSVDSLMGVPIVEQISVANGNVSFFANTHDDDFTREILPVGIAVEPDGSACYIADASEGKIVKIPAGNSSPIEDEWGGKTDWAFPNPGGIDASPGTVWASDASGAIYQATGSGSQLYYSLPYVVKAIHIDRDISTDGVDRFFFTDQPGFSEAFNLNPIGYGWNGSTVAGEEPARYLGGFVHGLSDGRLLLSNESLYEFEYHKPEAVLVSNADPSFPYLSDRQGTDRVIEFSVQHPWGSPPAPLHLRLIDPPDLAPYDDKNLDDPAGFDAPLAKFPYEANDNHVSIDDCVSAGECGLSLSPDGSGAARELIVDPSNPLFLKIPDDFSGENFLIQVSKVDPATSQLVPNRVLTLGPVFTSWKRLFVEEDRMFHQGGLLARDFDPLTCGAGGVEPECDQVILFDWTNVSAGDEIVLFQSDLPFESAFAVRAQVISVSAAGSPYTNSRRVTLNVNLADADLLWEASSDQPPNIGDTASLDFVIGKSAGIGVISPCDLDDNEMDYYLSCFDRPDRRNIFAVSPDGFIEYKAIAAARNAVPFVGPAAGIFGGYEMAPGGTCANPIIQPTPGYNPTPRWQFAALWFQSISEPNHIWLGGAEFSADLDVCTVCQGSSYPMPQMLGISALPHNISYVFNGSVARYCPVPYDNLQRAIANTSNHELVHQFYVNSSDPQSLGHDDRCSWVSVGAVRCDVPAVSCMVSANGCLMNPSRDGFNVVNRLDRFDLVCGDPSCPNGQPGCCTAGSPGCVLPGDGSVRHFVDPITGVAP